MNMKRLLTLLAFFATLQASAQQVNPVPDYVFANRMSAGRNTVTDTAAYFSIGPRYGATRGMMPPMVVDTASFSANKRNGLLIFSVQKNKFLYWDSVGVKWAEMAGTGGSAITGLGVAGYMPEFTTTTNLDTTRLYHSAGRFAIGSTTTSNGVFNVYGGQSYFDTSLLVSDFFIANKSTKNVGIGSNLNPDRKLIVTVAPGTNATDGVRVSDGTRNLSTVITGPSYVYLGVPSNSGMLYNNANLSLASDGGFISFHTVNNEAMRINGSNELQLGNTTDLGAYVFQATGNIYNTGNAYLVATSGTFTVGTTSPTAGFKADIRGRTQITGADGYLLDIQTNAANGTKLQFYVDGSEASFLSAGTVVRDMKFYLSGEKIRFSASGGAVFIPQSAAPTATAGAVYYDSDDNKLKVYNGSTWVDLH